MTQCQYEPCLFRYLLCPGEECLLLQYVDDSLISGTQRAIESLEGIQHFTYLTSLNCSKNKLEHLDVSKNKALKYLNCSSNNLVELDLSHNMLERCNCSNNNSNGKVMTLNKLKRASMKAFIKIDKRFMLQ